MRQIVTPFLLAALVGGCQHQGFANRTSSLAEATSAAAGTATATAADAASADAASDVPLTLSDDVYKPQPFQSHASEGYLGMTVNYAPVEALRKTLEAGIPYPIKNRGEAHVTVLTPDEYKVLAQRLGAARLDQLAQAAAPAIQAARFSAICVGHGQADVGGQELHTWFLVLDSDDLTTLRNNLKAEFVKAGGDPTAFDADLFFPHITLGFTSRDLFYEDGVIKDATSCIRPVATGA